ncbi:MAG: hypothetical protein J2P45_15835, partial [Candidatus Dormibacteraeota bacterium]|nr:hypothetical protein [Candidatus Dormibacteraeota bacterium]
AEVARDHVRRLAGALRTAGADPQHSDANYLVAHAPGAAGALLRREVTVRDCASFGLEGWVRLAAPGRAELEAVLSAIQDLRTEG